MRFKAFKTPKGASIWVEVNKIEMVESGGEGYCAVHMTSGGLHLVRGDPALIVREIEQGAKNGNATS